MELGSSQTHRSTMSPLALELHDETHRTAQIRFDEFPEGPGRMRQWLHAIPMTDSHQAF